MPKKGKSKSSKTKVSKKKSEGDLPKLHNGSGKFFMENGDIYEGEYCAHRIGLVWREGKGVYTTHDGQIYTGFWKDDKLLPNEDLTINYPNGHVFYGRLFKEKYNGPATYSIREDMNVSAQFANNQPTGECILIDSLGDLWYAIAEEKSDSCIFRLQNYFFFNITEDRGIGLPKIIKYPKLSDIPNKPIPPPPPEPEPEPEPKSQPASKTVTPTVSIIIPPFEETKDKKKEKGGKDKKKKKKEEVPVEVPVVEEEHKETEEEIQARLKKERLMKIFDRQKEEEIFKETTKTLNDLDFTECAWYQDYLKFKTIKEIILDKLETDGVAALTKEEKKWCRNYKRCQEINLVQKLIKELEKDQEGDTKLLEEFQSELHKHKSKAISTYYPRIFWDMFYESQDIWDADYVPAQQEDNIFDNNKCYTPNKYAGDNFEEVYVQTEEK